MKKLLIVVFLMLTFGISLAQKNVDFTYFNVMLPEDCELDVDAMQFDLRSVAYKNLDNTFSYYVCFFYLEEDFDITEKLRDELQDLFMIDLDKTGYVGLTVGGGEDPMLFISLEDGTSLFNVGVFADYINDVGICICGRDARPVTSEEKYSTWTSFKRPEIRKLEGHYWMEDVDQMRSERIFGSVYTDYNNELEHYTLNGYNIDMPSGMMLNEKENFVEYSNEDGSLLVIVEDLPSSPVESAGSMLSEILSGFNINLLNQGIGTCIHADKDAILFYSGTVTGKGQLATAILFDIENNRTTNITVIGNEQSASKIWGIVRSVYAL